MKMKRLAEGREDRAHRCVSVFVILLCFFFSIREFSPQNVGLTLFQCPDIDSDLRSGSVVRQQGCTFHRSATLAALLELSVHTTT